MIQNPVTGFNLQAESVQLYLIFERLICNCFDPGQNFILAVSGGADSTALAVIMKILSTRRDYKFSVVHINHNIRSEAGDDANFVQQLCETLNLPFKIISINAPKLSIIWHLGLEETGRIARNRLFIHHAAKNGANAIFTAHHAGDLCEDILMRLSRGSAWPALAGMKMRQGIFFRPFLHTAPKRLREFLTIENIGWREDLSNLDLKFTRNRFRHQLVPWLVRENPAFLEQSIKLNELGQIDSQYWQKEVSKKLASFPLQQLDNSEKPTLLLSAPLLSQCEKALRLRLYVHAIKTLALKSFQESNPQIRTDNLLKADEAWENKNWLKTFQQPGKITLTINKNGIHVAIAENIPKK